MHTQSHTHDPVAARCAATTRHGLPCHGPALPHSPFCAFHDACTAEAVAAGRARGGAAPRRRIRRLPRRLDYLQVADLTGELFVEALNYANPADPRSLRAVTQLARVLLHAVGRPKDSYVPPAEDTEPSADAPHLLRVYPHLTAAMEALLAAETRTPPPVPQGHNLASDFERHRDYTFQPTDPGARIEELPTAWLDAVLAPAPSTEENLAECPEEAAEWDRALAVAPAPVVSPDARPDHHQAPSDDPEPLLAGGPEGQPMLAQAFMPGKPEPTPPSPGGTADAVPGTMTPSFDPRDNPDPESAAPAAEPHDSQRPEQGGEQGLDRAWTGHLATDSFSATDLAPAPPPDTASGPDLPGFARPRSLVYLRPKPRDPFG